MKWRTGTITLILAALAVVPALGGGLVLMPIQDNTLYEVAPGQDGNGGPPSNGAGDYIFAGVTANFGEARRGLMAFDIAGSVPPGSVVTSVTLTLEMSRSISGPSMVTLHRVTSDWGEGTSDAPGEEGTGAPATTGDATWFHTFYPGSFWGTNGGDFSATASATLSVDSTGPYTWGSTPEMVADVQAWLDNPSTNYGWLLMGDEQAQPSAKRFNSRENGVGIPQLAITYQAPVPTAPVWTLILLTAALISIAGWKLRGVVSRRS